MRATFAFLLLSLSACGIDATGRAKIGERTPSTVADTLPAPPSSTSGQAPASSPPPTVDAFTGAAAFTGAIGPSTSNEDHDDPARSACLSCHDGSGDAPRFLAGGTVFADAAGTIPLAGVEVRVRDDAGNAVSAFTDTRGNFFVPATNAMSVMFPAAAGVRSSTSARVMTAHAPNGDCSSSTCHGGGAGFVHLP